MTIEELFESDASLASCFVVVRVERSRVIALNESRAWDETPWKAAAYRVREDAYNDARAMRGLVVYVRRGELPPVSGLLMPS